MSDQLLGILKVALLALLYLFFARVLWAVWSEVRGPRRGRVPANGGGGTMAAPRPVEAPVSSGKRAKKAMATKLVVMQPKERKGATFAITGEITIGRAVDSTISIPDDTWVSQLHARVLRTAGGETWLEDLGSTNGSYLNGARLTSAQLLRKGDRVQIGSTVWEAH